MARRWSFLLPLAFFAPPASPDHHHHHASGSRGYPTGGDGASVQYFSTPFFSLHPFHPVHGRIDRPIGVLTLFLYLGGPHGSSPRRSGRQEIRPYGGAYGRDMFVLGSLLQYVVFATGGGGGCFSSSVLHAVSLRPHRPAAASAYRDGDRRFTTPRPFSYAFRPLAFYALLAMLDR